jgi:hypothetical protein
MARRISLAAPQVLPAAEPDLSSAHKRAVEGAIRWAWQQLVAANDAVLHDGSEEDITEAIELQLGRRESGRRVAPGLKDFDHVVRGAKQRAADAGNEKQPDLTFRPPASRYIEIANLAYWGYFVECKIIEDGHPSRTVASYSNDGVKRFATGVYAARMPCGMMLAYVRGTQDPVRSLTPHLPLHGARTISPGKCQDICTTVHARTGLAAPCVDVNLCHLWVHVPRIRVDHN